MSARDELIEHFASVLYENHDVLAEWHYVTTEDAAEFRAIAAKKVDAVLHEAAESLREEASTWDGWPEKVANMRFSADLIDPEVAKP